MGAMTILSMVESARRGTAPIVGIPLEGRHPFLIKRELLTDSLKGLTIIDAGIQYNLKGEPSALELFATAPGVKASRTLWPLESLYEVKQANWTWAREKRKQRTAKLLPKLSAKDRHIAKLQKQIEKIERYLSTPRHPYLIPPVCAKGIRERDESELKALVNLQAEGSLLGVEHTTMGQEWARWKREAGKRDWIQRQGRRCIPGRGEEIGAISTTQLYKLLAEKGITVKKWSELHKHDKDRCGSLTGYLGSLWKFTNCQRRPQYWFDPHKGDSVGPELYAHWLFGLRERNQLVSEIEALRQI